MVQVLPAVPKREKKSFMEKLGPGLPMLLQGGMQFAGKIHEGKQKNQQMQQENEAAKKIGVDLSGITDPDTRRQLIVEGLKGNVKKQEYASELMNNEKILRDLEKRRKLPEGSLQSYLKDPKFAEQISRLEKEKTPVGGLAGMPFSSEEQKAMEDVIASNPDASASQLELEFSKVGLAPGRYKTAVETRRREQEMAKGSFEPESEKLEAKRVSEISDRIVKDYQVAQTENLRLGKQETLLKSGKLSAPMMVKTLDTLGLPLAVLGNPETEEFQKIEADYVRDVSSVFPGQIRVFEIQSYMKTVPSLMNSPGGMAAIIRNRRLLNQGKIIKFEAFKNIIKENGGKKPQNLDLLIEERIGPQMAELGEEFMNGIQEQTDKFQTKLKMYDQEGRVYDIPANLAEKAMKQQGLMFR